MMGCTVEQRTTAREATRALLAHERVVAADVLAPDVHPVGAWALDVTVEGGDVPPGVLATLAEHGLSVRDVSTRGEPTHAVVTATV